MKKILCFTLALLLCLSSVCTAYASSTDSDHGGTGGSLGDNHGGTGGSIDWDKLQPCDDELINKAKETLNYMIFPDKARIFIIAPPISKILTIKSKTAFTR